MHRGIAKAIEALRVELELVVVVVVVEVIGGGEYEDGC